ncbi:hypothetical protein PG995_005611 [Apiospora arundinis]
MRPITMDQEDPKTPGQTQDVPRLRTFASPSDIGKKEDSRRVKFELFFDLWFVANIQTLSESKQIVEASDLRAFLGFLCILWFTWFIVCMFDVRFMTDSIFERVIRIVQFGSMVGFTVVVHKFNPEQQFTNAPEQQDSSKRHSTSFETLSLILMAVRLSLVAQYCSDYWLRRRERTHHKEFSKDKPDEKPILAAAAVHLIAAIVYLGIAFRFDNHHNSRAYMVWYIGSALEAILQLALACKYKVLGFGETKLTERLAVFTVVILGEGISEITKNILLVSENGAYWSSSTNGVFVAAVATTYFLYLLYFDWMNHEHLRGYRQLIYSFLHFPFHASLLLFGAGSAVFIKWWQASKIISGYDIKMNNTVVQVIAWSESELRDHHFANKSAAVVNGLWNITQEVNKDYPIKYSTSWEGFNSSLSDIMSVPDSVWNKPNGEYDNSTAYEKWNGSIVKYQLSIYNTILNAFEINPSQDGDDDGDYWDIFVRDVTRMKTTFRYIYACAGIVLLLMTFFHVLTLAKRQWKAYDYVRVGLYAAAGLGLGLIPLMSTPKNVHHVVDFIETPWILPTICLVVFCVFLVTHIHRPPMPQFAKKLFPSRRTKKSWEHWPAGYRSLGAQTHEESRVGGNGHRDVGFTPGYISLQSLEHESAR